MAEKICFLGRGGSGKNTITQNIGHALCRLGYKVLLIGNDITFSSTILLRKDLDITPVLEIYRENYDISLKDCIIPTDCGVFCLEIDSIDPGVGCLARGISIIDEMLDEQNILNELSIDYVLYNFLGETPCAGFILPIREGLMCKCVLITNTSFASIATTNCILQAISKNNPQSVSTQMIINNTACNSDSQIAENYAKKVNADILARIGFCKQLAYCELAQCTAFDANEACDTAQIFMNAAVALTRQTKENIVEPLSRDELLLWLKKIKNQDLENLISREGSFDV